ncbi:MAG: polymerase nonessential primary-like sigma factor [Actinomycetota bacterium]|jgi:RNA polymerase nonessential primary-like sigma factor|nr:polymerase nonessential primary-like sigma factor [Actinomycetota bacterium]
MVEDAAVRVAHEVDELDREAGAPDLVRLYLDEIGRAPLLDAATEVELARRIEAGLFARHLLDGLGQRRSAKLRLARRVATSYELAAIAADGEQAKRAFIRANLRLVVSLARRYNRVSMPLLDLIQEGNVGLVRAVEKFDYTRGYKFSTYATWWIRQSIGRAIAEQSRTVRLPVHQVEKLSRLARVRRELHTSLGREPSEIEVSRESSLPVEVIADLDAISMTPASLDSIVGEDGGTTLGDLVDTADPGPEDLVVEWAHRADLIRLLDRLDAREVEVIRSRYGLRHERRETYDEIAARLGVSRERARQIEREALQRLRCWVSSDPD